MLTYDLIPRYTAGSPAMVKDESLARRVAEEEREAYQACLEGYRGVEEKEEAEREGLEGIVLLNNGKVYTDMLTDKVYTGIPYGSIRHPNRLFVLVKGRQETYFYRRQVLVVLAKTTFRDDNMIRVLQELQDKYQIEPYGNVAAELWQGRTTV